MITRKTMRQSVMATAFAAAMLVIAQPVFADTIELNNWWAGRGSVNINYTGPVWYDSSQGIVNISESGGAGGFKTYDLTTDPGRSSPFQTFCVDIFHSFSFSVDSVDASPTITPGGLSSAALLNLGKLYTQYGSNIVSMSSSNLDEVAFQIAVWAIVSDGSAINSSDNFDLTASGGQPLQVTSGTSGAVGTAQLWLNSLAKTNSQYAAQFLMVQNTTSTGHGIAQHVVYFTPASPVPEPKTYAMLLAGLGLLGFIANRGKKKHQQMPTGFA